MRNPEYEFIPTDASEMVAQMIADYESLSGETVQPGSPENLMMQWVASVVLQERVKGNYAANQNVPSRAEGENLDALAELYYAQERPSAKPATCTMRFNISEAQTSAILVPAGTRVTDGAQTLYWETTEDAWVAVGSTYVDASVRCQTAGTQGNGYAVGQINAAVDLYDYYSGCANITESGGGSDVATDDELYALLRASMYAYSTAGPRGAYEYHARAVSNEIADVLAIRPGELRTEELPLYTLAGVKYGFIGGDELDAASLIVCPHGSTTPAEKDTDYEVVYSAGLLRIKVLGGGALASETSLDVTINAICAGRVSIYALMDDGTKAGTEVKAAILAACSDDSVRPMSDLVSVADPVEVSYNINVTYWLSASSPVGGDETRAAVEAAVADYVAWQRGRLGRDINPSVLIGKLMQTGVKRVAITSPVYTPLNNGSDGYAPEFAVFGTTTITNGGVEYE